MKTVEELIHEINEEELCSPHYVEENIDLDGAVEVDTVDLDEHRWYVLGTVVYKMGDRFLGIRGPVSRKSEETEFSDIGIVCEAFEMVAIPSVTYKRKPTK